LERKDKIRKLFNSYIQGDISREKLGEFLSGFIDEADKAYLSELLLQELEKEPDMQGQEDLIRDIADSAELKIFAATKSGTKVIRLRKWISVAASLLIAISVLSYFLIHKPATTNSYQASTTDIPAGSNSAILTLGNGSKINLDVQKGGRLQAQPNTVIDRVAGSLQYGKSDDPGSKFAYNILETPRGGQYQLTLPDGSKVWLNAATKIKYPTSFNGSDRTVELSGEAYFEISKNKTKPFRVISGEQTIEVLGTHFNIMAYNDESYKRSTLLEGSIKVIAHGQQKMIKPGEQVTVDKNNRLDISEADLDANMAWKNGKTYFKNTDIPTMMRSLGRWYNLTIEYQGEISRRHFTGGISRQSSLSGMLKILEMNDIHTRIEGRKLIVLP